MSNQNLRIINNRNPNQNHSLQRSRQTNSQHHLQHHNKLRTRTTRMHSNVHLLSREKLLMQMTNQWSHSEIIRTQSENQSLRSRSITKTELQNNKRRKRIRKRLKLFTENQLVLKQITWTILRNLKNKIKSQKQRLKNPRRRKTKNQLKKLQLKLHQKKKNLSRDKNSQM